MIDYKDALQHIKNIIDLEWNGMITLTEYRERIEDVVLVALDDETEKESKWKNAKYILKTKLEWHME